MTHYEFSKKLSLRSNAVGMRASYGLSVLDAKDQFADLCVFTADTSTSAGLDRFKTTYPSDFFDVGIAEQALVAVAAGYVASGGQALASTFAPFISLRAAEQIRLSLGYMKIPLVLVGLASGTALGYLGYTHCSFEDVALMLSIPNVFVYTPSDAYELRLLLPSIIKLQRPTYIRLTGATKTRPVLNSSFQSNLIDPIVLHESQANDLLVLTSGVITANLLDAISSLSDDSKARISVHLLPFCDSSSNNTKLINLLCSFKNLLVLDEGSFFGVPAYISKIIADNNISINFDYICHPQSYIPCGSHDFMLDQLGLSSPKLVEKIEFLISQ